MGNNAGVVTVKSASYLRDIPLEQAVQYAKTIGKFFGSVPDQDAGQIQVKKVAAPRWSPRWIAGWLAIVLGFLAVVLLVLGVVTHLWRDQFPPDARGYYLFLGGIALTALSALVLGLYLRLGRKPPPPPPPLDSRKAQSS
jgi:hypothetical protein